MATTSNPVLTRADFRPTSEPGAGTMTLGGTISKTLALLGILTATATFAWLQTGAGLAEPDKLGTLFLVGILGGFGVALYTVISNKRRFLEGERAIIDLSVAFP